jgi:hypothetical protein
MMYSGVELIRASGRQAERLDRLRPVEPVAPVDDSTPSHSSLDSETQGALLRFARFVHGEKGQKDKPTPNKRSAKGVPQAYLNQIGFTPDESTKTGSLIDIYV